MFLELEYDIRHLVYNGMDLKDIVPFSFSCTMVRNETENARTRLKIAMVCNLTRLPSNYSWSPLDLEKKCITATCDNSQYIFQKIPTGRIAIVYCRHYVETPADRRVCPVLIQYQDINTPSEMKRVMATDVSLGTDSDSVSNGSCLSKVEIGGKVYDVQTRVPVTMKICHNTYGTRVVLKGHVYVSQGYFHPRWRKEVQLDSHILWESVAVMLD
jgi:hypothetical protein